jgi:hypothetical protein
MWLMIHFQYWLSHDEISETRHHAHMSWELFFVRICQIIVTYLLGYAILSYHIKNNLFDR